MGSGERQVLYYAVEADHDVVKMNSIPNVDWIKFLERRRSCFIYYPYLESEYNYLPKITGFGYKYHLYQWSGDRGIHYRSASELDRSMKHFIEIIKNNPKIISTWRDLALDWDNRAKELVTLFENKKSNISLTEFKYYYDKFVQILLYTVTIPYLCLSAIDTALQKGESKKKFEKILNILNPLRTFTTYPQLERSMLSHFFNLIATETGIKDHDLLDKLTPKEIQNYIETKELPSKKFPISNKKEG